jgi:phenylalanyl-tRNA synthetase beta chain
MAGVCGKVRPDICEAFGIASPLYYAELDITAFLASPGAVPSYRALPRYPAVERDFCLVLPEHMYSSVISGEIMSISNLVEQVEPFDVYRGEKLGEGLKSIAFAVRLRASDRTLTDAEADEVCRRIIETVKARHGAVLRT